MAAGAGRHPSPEGSPAFAQPPAPAVSTWDGGDGSSSEAPTPVAAIPHGTFQGFALHGCRCPECVERQVGYDHVKASLIAQGVELFTCYGCGRDDLTRPLPFCGVCQRDLWNVRDEMERKLRERGVVA